MLENIPQEMRSYDQWVMWRYETKDDGKKPTKVPYQTNGYKAAVTEPSTWTTYEQVTQALQTGNFSGIGFVLTSSDPFAFVDLDDTKGNAEYIALQNKIFNSFDSYAELSPSGIGLHIICKGSIPKGKKKSSVELYSEARFMTMTGNVYRASPISDCNELLNSLWSFLGGEYDATQAKPAQEAQQSEAPETQDDEIINQASTAANGKKFVDLFYGNWATYYSSQSEADFALIDIIAFYTQEKAQITRIFHSSGLGQRDKAKRPDYLREMIKRSFDKQVKPVDAAALVGSIEQAVAAAKTAPATTPLPDQNKSSLGPYSLPPGLVGRLAQAIYAAAPRPVPEIALAASIGMLAGITGRAYNISGTGLNQYVLLLAKTGTGKEAISAGVNALFNECAKIVPVSKEYIGPTLIASPQALIKRLSKNRSFVSIIGEFGQRLQEMTGKNAQGAQKGVQTALLDLFNKSGKGQSFGAMAYSDSEKNIDSIEAPALSLIGESTPDTFFEAVDERSIRSGLIPRFTVIEYVGDRPDLNVNRSDITQNADLISEIGAVLGQSANLNHNNFVTNVGMCPQSEELFDKFNKFCDNKIRGSDDVNRELWNRAHMKALKLAALVAVGCNYINPSITIDVANWAIDIEAHNIERLMARFRTGEVGERMETAETVQVRKIQQIIAEWISTPYENLSAYDRDFEAAHKLKAVPFRYISKRAERLACFRNDTRGGKFAVEKTLKTLEDWGQIQAQKNKLVYGSSALVYVVLNAHSLLDDAKLTVR